MNIICTPVTEVAVKGLIRGEMIPSAAHPLPDLSEWKQKIKNVQYLYAECNCKKSEIIMSMIIQNLAQISDSG